MTRPFDLPGRSPVYASNGIAATSHPLATSAAITILREGGNAVDAAIAAQAVLCVAEPQMTGIGGDCFVIVAEPDGTVHGLNGSGRAPKEAKLQWYLDNKITQIDRASPHSVTVPGALKGWEKLHNKFGTMDWARLFADAVHLANEGVAVAPRVARDWSTTVEKLSHNAGAAKHFLYDGKAPIVGQRVLNQALGGVLQRVAKEGVSAFYQGEVAADITDTVRQLGGFMSEEDLAACEADWVELISTNYRGYDILEIPPNGQGITALIMLNLLSEINSNFEPGSPERFHEALELGRIAYSVRDAYVSDPATMQASVKKMLSHEHTVELLKLYNPQQRNKTISLPKLPDSNTVYLTIVDRDRRAVSFINSIYGTFGSGIVTEKTGIVLQDRGGCFVVEAGHPNAIDGGKRSMHTIIPAMALKDGLPAYSFGVMGGDYQPMGHAHVLANMLDYGMDPQEALDFPRAFWDIAGKIEVESGIAKTVLDGLAMRGHEFAFGRLFGGGQIIQIDYQNGMYCAGSDPRKDGHAGGY